MSERQNIEWKRSWQDEYLKWVCGFANAQGGSIFIGKSDDGTVCGLLNAKKLLEDIPGKAKQQLGLTLDVNLHEEKVKWGQSNFPCIWEVKWGPLLLRHLRYAPSMHFKRGIPEGIQRATPRPEDRGHSKRARIA